MYIEQRRQGWYFTLTVPLHLRAAVGKNKIIESLKTRDKVHAQALAYRKVADWKAHFAKLEQNENQPLPQSFTEMAFQHRDSLEDAKRSGDEHLILAVEQTIEDRGAALERTPSATGEQVAHFYGIATGRYIPTDTHLDDWLSELNLAPKTRDMWESEVKRLTAKFPTTNLVVKPSVRAWCVSRMKEGAASKTVGKTLTACRGYWGYLQARSIKLTDTKPFDDLKLTNKTSEAKRTSVASYIPFTAPEVVSLHRAAVDKGDTALADLIKLAAYTGVRIEEACSIKLEDVAGDNSSLKVTDSKTSAGIREVPIHSALVALVKQMREASKDGFLVTGTNAENKYGIRSNAIGKRFGRLKSSLGFQKDRHTFHSIRKTFVTQLETAGVAENVAAQIVGHEIETMTYGTYSAGVPLSVKRQAVEHVKYEWAA